MLPGESLSPTHFAAYNNELESIHTIEDMGVNINGVKVSVLMYADDLVLLSQTADGLQRGINDLYSLCTENDLTVNTSKSKLMYVSKGRPAKLPVIEYNLQPLQWVDSIKYLGVTLSETNNFTEGMKAICQQASKSQTVIGMHMLKHPTVSLNHIFQLFDTLIKPILTYGCAVWGTGNYTDIETYHNKFLNRTLRVKSSTNTCLLYIDAFWLWNLYGRPYHGHLYHSMRSSRAQFKYALKYAKRIEETAKADALAKDLGGQKFDEFWKSVNKINQSSQLHTTTIDGITGEANIAEHWRTHFHGILNTNICDQTLKSSILGTLDDIQHDARMTVCYTDVQTLIRNLEFGKSAGPDSICAEALKCAHDQLSVLLSLCFTLFLSHGHLPLKLIQTTIVPIIKNKCGNISSSNNYRPIALATIISKLLESILLMKCEEYLCTSANQFGFKKAHGTELCIYTLREYIELYRKRSTTVFVTFLDASKAFDRLDHWLLFKKLIKRKVPLFIVRLLIVWYSLQRMHIRWGNTFSTSFCVSNGVKQGGIISPVLFNVYMDDLSCALNRSNIGGRIGGEIVNHLSYADDLCLICLSSAGMQKLLNVCSNYATEHSLSYNANKSYSLCFKATTIKFERPTLYFGQMSIPNVTDCRYLGITISVKNCDLDLKRQKRRFDANTNMLLRKFVKCSPDVKCYLFKTYCCNLYCAPFWYDSTKTAMKNLKVAYNNSLRRLLGLPSHNSASSMFVNLNIPSFGELLRKYVYNFRNRLETSDNVIIRGIYLSHITFQSGIWDWWRDILSP